MAIITPNEDNSNTKTDGTHAAHVVKKLENGKRSGTKLVIIVKLCNTEECRETQMSNDSKTSIRCAYMLQLLHNGRRIMTHADFAHNTIPRKECL